MKSTLFFGYANLKGYTFDIINNTQPMNIRSFVSDNQAKEEKIVVASYKGKMVGALKFKTVMLPVSLIEGVQFHQKSLNKEVILIDLYFLHESTDSNNSTVMSGLILKMQKYARKNGYDVAIGYAHNDFSKMTSSAGYSFLKLKSEQIKTCKEYFSAAFPNVEQPFLIDFKNSLVSLMSRSSKASNTLMPTAA